MASYQGYTEHYHQQPQVFQQYDSSPIPKPAEHSDLEAVRYRSYPPDPVLNEKEQSRKICGLRVLTFWIVLAIFVVILAGGIGGGIGGGLASSSNSSNGGSVATKTVTATGSAAPAASSAIPSTGFTRLYCKNDTIYTTPTGDRFKEYCAIDWASGDNAVGGGTVQDLVIRPAGTFHSCMNQCASYNKNNPKAPPCKAIAYDADLTLVIHDEGNPGNCWFKSAPGTHTTLSDTDPFPERMGVAVLL